MLKGTEADRLEAYRNIYKHFQFSNTDSALHYLDQGVAYFRLRAYPKGEAMLLNLQGVEYTNQGLMALGRSRHQEALAIFTTLRDSNGIGVAHNGLGVLEGKISNYSEAMRHFLVALRAYESTGNKEGISATYLKMGVVNEFSGNLDKAVEYYKRALEISSASPNKTNNIIYLYNNLGSAYCRMKKWEDAIYYLNLALEATTDPKLAQIRILPLNNIANVYKMKGNDAKALALYEEGLAIARNGKMREEEARLMLNRASILAKKDRAYAMRTLYQSLDMCRQIGNKGLEAEIMTEIKEMYKTEGRYKEALQMLEAQKDMQDSQFTLQKEKEIANLQSVYELSRSNDKVQKLEEWNSRERLLRNIIAGAAIGLAVALLFLVIYYRRVRRLNARISRREKELEKLNGLKDRLFSIIGHDLRGPVGQVAPVLEILAEDDIEPAERKFLVGALHDSNVAILETLDKLLNWGKVQMKGYKPAREEIAASRTVKEILRLNSSALSKKQVALDNAIPEDVRITADPEHFSFILRNLISNAIKYTPAGGQIHLTANRSAKPGEVIFQVRDNGVGMDPERLGEIFKPDSRSLPGTNNEKGYSIGLVLCKEFVESNGGSIWAESAPGAGSAFYFSMPAA